MQTHYAFMQLPNSDFSHRFLQGCNFEGSNLKGSNFSHCSLSFSNFKNANLQGANLTASNLLGVDFTGANLEDVDFSCCIGNGIDVFSMQLVESPFVWNRENVFIGYSKMPLEEFVKKTRENLENLTSEYAINLIKYENILKECINLTIGEQEWKK